MKNSRSEYTANNALSASIITSSPRVYRARNTAKPENDFIGGVCFIVLFFACFIPLYL